MSKTLKRMTPVIAILLVIVVVVNTAWVSAAQFSIQRTSEEDSHGEAKNYLVDSSSFIQKNMFARMQKVLSLYITPKDWQGYEEQAGIYIAREEYDKALECIEKAVELSNEASALEQSSLWLQKGCLHTLKGEYEAALEALQKSTEGNPDSSESYLIMAQIYLEQGDEEQTLLNMEAYLELNPGNADAESMVAQLYMSREDYTQARKWLKRAQESGGGAEPYYQYGLCLIQEGRFAEAAEYLDQAIELDDAVGEVYYYRSICYLATEQYEEALADLKETRERTQDSDIRSEAERLIKELEVV